jgi:hypothetical protein
MKNTELCLRILFIAAAFWGLTAASCLGITKAGGSGGLAPNALVNPTPNPSASQDPRVVEQAQSCTQQDISLQISQCPHRGH